MDVIAPEQADRFRRDTEALVGRAIARDEKLLVAVSGGPDSLGLLLLAHSVYGDRVHAATVDHRLRPAGAVEARFVAEVCTTRAIDHKTLTGCVADADATSGAQARARSLRYALLESWAAHLGCGWLATGHHLEDQAETILMRLARGSGLPGLASIRARRPAGTPHAAVAVVRPLLGWRRHELLAIVERASLIPVDDPSNRSGQHDRTHFRALLAQRPLLAPERLAASASHLGDCEDALAWSERREWGWRARTEGRAIRHVEVGGLPAELKRRLTARAIDAVRLEQSIAASWRTDKVARLVGLLDAGRTATLAGVKCTGGASWRFEPAPPRSQLRAQPSSS